MQQDHELDQVRARLLPERLLAAAKEIGHQRGDAVGQRVGVEIVVQRVVAVRRVETDLDVVVAAAVTLEDVADLPAEVALSLPGPGPPTLRAGSLGAIREELLDVGIHAGRGLARADGADDDHAGVEAALGNDEPARLRCARPGDGPVMLLAEDQEQILARARARDTAAAAAASPADPAARRRCRRSESDDARAAKNGVLNHSVAYV